MDYNTDREHLVLPEYGRNIQNMVNYCMSIPDRAERQYCAETIVRVMEMMQPDVSGTPDAQKVLWDHLARMSHYQLDIDYPVEITREEEITKKPDRVAYPMSNIRLRQYGHLLESLLKKLGDIEDGAEKDRLIELTANQMRKDLFYWNKDALNEERIADDMAKYTEGKVQMELGKYRFSNNVPNSNFTKSTFRKKGRK